MKDTFIDSTGDPRREALVRQVPVGELTLAMHQERLRREMAKLEERLEEQKEMDVLISPAEKYRRRVEKRRKDSVLSRPEYEGRAMWRHSEARKLVAEGKTLKEIGKILGVHWRSVYRLISQ